MKIKFNKLVLSTKKKKYEIPLSNSITFFYGKIGAGKSTIPRLIKFCLGGSLKETPALQSNFVAASLELTIGDHLVQLDREKGSTSVVASWKKFSNGESMALQVPMQTKEESLITGAKVHNISDLIFYLAGREPPFVLKSKYNVDTELVRLSFRDLMWYCYLDQDHIDSSFFYLEQGDDFSRRNKSQDAIRFILGFKFDQIVKLQSGLNQAREDKASKLASIDQITSFLEESGLISRDEIEKTRKSLIAELNETENEITRIKKTTYVKNNPLDDLISKRNRVRSLIEKTRSKIDDVKSQMSEQSRLRSEFITANTRIDRSSAAREVFKNVEFSTCPQCGQTIDKTNPDECILCKQPPKEQEKVVLTGPDLIERVKEIDDSINRLYLERKKLELSLKSQIQDLNETEEEITKLQKSSDSKYVAAASTLMERKGVLDGKINYLNQMLLFSNKMEQLEQEIATLNVKIEKIKKELDKEKIEAGKRQAILKDLEKMFADTLKQICFPGYKEDDKVTVSPDTYIPFLQPKNKEDQTTTTFTNLGSGGKKTIFKSCFALALHRLAAKKGLPLPTFLIIDTPMKNTSPRENKEIFESFYQFVYKLSQTELKNRQIIIIDQEFYKSKEKAPDDMIVRHMTPDNPKYPPLIGYYRGH